MAKTQSLGAQTSQTLSRVRMKPGAANIGINLMTIYHRSEIIYIYTCPLEFLHAWPGKKYKGF